MLSYPALKSNLMCPISAPNECGSIFSKGSKPVNNTIFSHLFYRRSELFLP